MKQFFKFMFASMLGFILTCVIIFFIALGIFHSAIKKEVVTVPKNTILHLKLNNQISDRTSNNPMKNFDFNTFKPKYIPGLNDILKDIKKAKTDDHIKGIYLDLSYMPAGIATIEEIRNALTDFKSSGKFIISYSEVYTQKTYYLASVSDKIYLNPQGVLIFKGLNAQMMFLKGTLDKLDIDVQIVRHGKFKSAVEPFMLNKMSKENREQLQTYVSSIWDHIVNNISDSRGIRINKLNEIADNLLIQKPEDAVKYHFIDKLMYKDELLDEFHKQLSTKKNKKISFMSLDKYSYVPSPKIKRFRNKIAVIYASGSIKSGEGDEQSIGSEKISKVIRKARLDTTVKAVVFRVNSPGGSALASEIIWREVSLTKKVKPVIVSMGNLAASGGYYISCAANKIIASPNTITGSIGVFGIIPNFKGLFNNKLGITFDNVKTNKNSGFISVNRPMTTYEREVLKKEIENVYQTFIKHVAEGRNMTVAAVDKIGQGRVWSGVDAKRIGLIDGFGGLDKAVKIAASMAELKNYRIVSMPKQKLPFVQLIEDITGKKHSSFIKKELGVNYKYYDYLQSISKMKGIQARMPYMINIY